MQYMVSRFSILSPILLLLASLNFATTLSQISKDHAVYVSAQNGDVLSITTERRMGTDPDYVYIFGPDGKLQQRLEILTSTTTEVLLHSGSGVYKILPVNYTYIHTYAIPGSRPMVVEPFDHQELLRVDGIRDLYFYVPGSTPSMTFHAHSMQSSNTIQEELFDPTGALVHTFVLAPNTFQEDYTVEAPAPGFWRCRFQTASYDKCGAWLEGVPNYFASSPGAWFAPSFPGANATLFADAGSVVSTGAKIGVNWWMNPGQAAAYEAERDAIVQARMDTARITVDWAWREPQNDNGDPLAINWQGFSFSGHDSRMAAFYNDIVSMIPDAMPVLMFYWSSSVQWQSENPAAWTQNQREEYAEFVLASMIHTIAPDLEDPPGSGPAYDFVWIEILNEPNLTMGSANYQAYIDLVVTVGQRLREHPDPRINALKIVAPGIGWVWGQSNAEMENWIGKLLDQADAYVDGVNWHQYEYLRLEECHRYAEDIEKVKNWLDTRGNGVADEWILMTETNQHGGAPTYWKRQDTFYAAIWWSGACLAALRGGIDFMHYYQLVDDPPGSYNYKGMMFNDGPYQPPLFPGGSPHAGKPVLGAAGFINRHRRDQVISSACDHPDISHVVTLSEDKRVVTVLLVNLFDRNIHLGMQIDLPPELKHEPYITHIFQLEKESGQGGVTPPELEIVERPEWSLRPLLSSIYAQFSLSPKTIYAVTFDFRQSAHPDF